MPKNVRRAWLLAGAATLGAASAGLILRGARDIPDESAGVPGEKPATATSASGMPMRPFGSTGVLVSELAFGAWAIGGQAYGEVDKDVALSALAIAEEHGCNVVDTAAVYGESESILGGFLPTRRSKWFVSTKYSGQRPGILRTLEQQLDRLKCDAVDLYMIHWAPGRAERGLYDDLYRAKKQGKTRYVGVSLNSVSDIDYVLDQSIVDGFMLPFSILEPDPFLSRAKRIRDSGKAVLARSVLREGLLTGKYKASTRFSSGRDQRSSWKPDKISTLVDQVERFRFLESETSSMTAAAVGYALSYPGISTVVLGTKNPAQALQNFAELRGTRLSQEALQRVSSLQLSIGLRQRVGLRGYVRQLVRHVAP